MEKENKDLEPVVDGFEKVERTMNDAEGFVEKNQKTILIVFAAVIAAIVLYFVLDTQYFQPKEEEAKSEILKAQQMFAIDSFQVALDGKEDDFSGFLDIIDNYGCTKTANLAKAYAGICYKQLGQYEEAVKMLDGFSGDDELISPSVKGAIADCYWDLDKADKAAKAYVSAADQADNEMLSPLYLKRAAMCQMQLGKNAEAVKLLERLTKDYPYCMEFAEATKLLEIAKAAK